MNLSPQSIAQPFSDTLLAGSFPSQSALSSWDLWCGSFPLTAVCTSSNGIFYASSDLIAKIIPLQLNILGCLFALLSSFSSSAVSSCLCRPFIFIVRPFWLIWGLGLHLICIRPKATQSTFTYFTHQLNKICVQAPFPKPLRLRLLADWVAEG